MKHNMHRYNAQIKEMLEQGMLYKSIAYTLNVEPFVLRVHLKTWFTIEKTIKVSYKEKPLSNIAKLQQNEADIMSLYRNGASVKSISDKYDIPYNPTFQFIAYRKRRDNE
jgi:DNA-binding CsgD family transcriptional regulator